MGVASSPEVCPLLQDGYLTARLESSKCSSVASNDHVSCSTVKGGKTTVEVSEDGMVTSKTVNDGSQAIEGGDGRKKRKKVC